MSRQFCSLLVVCLSVSAALAHENPKDSPTPEQVNENPQIYVGKTLVFDHMTLRGKAKTSPRIFRFIISSPQTTEFFPIPRGVQRLFFGTPDKSERVNTFIKSLNAIKTHSVRMTCEIMKRSDEVYVASVRRMDLIRWEHPNNAQGRVEEAALEDVMSDPPKYVGKIIAFDRVEFTGKRANRPARFAFAVKNPSGTNLAESFRKDQVVLFVTADKSAEVKNYVEKEFSNDRNHPLRLVCEFLKASEGKYFASIRRIELLGFDYDAPPPPDDSAKKQLELEKKYAGVPTEMGKKVQLNNKIQLFYAEAITVKEAASLGEYLEKNWKDQGYAVSIQLAKNGNMYQFRVPVKKGLERDPDCIRLYKQFAKSLSKHVFHRAAVEIHLCDQQFATLSVVLPLEN